MSQSAVLDPGRRSRPGSPPGAFGPWEGSTRGANGGATHPDPRTKPGTPAEEHEGFVGEVESCAHEAPGLAREVPEPHCRAKSPAREAPRLGREAQRAGAEAEGLDAAARGLALRRASSPEGG